MKPIGFYTILIGYTLIALQWLFSHDDRMDTVKRMQDRGFSRGLPFTMHMGACWGDIFIVTPIVACMVSGYYHDCMTNVSFFIFMVIGMLTSFVLHVGLYNGHSFPEAHTHGYRITQAGWTHMIYMGLFLGMVFTIYFGTPATPVPAWLIIFVSVALSVHVFFGVHIPLGLWNPKWYGRKPDAAAWITFLVVCGLLSWRTCVIVAIL